MNAVTVGASSGRSLSQSSHAVADESRMDVERKERDESRSSTEPNIRRRIVTKAGGRGRGRQTFEWIGRERIDVVARCHQNHQVPCGDGSRMDVDGEERRIQQFEGTEHQTTNNDEHINGGVPKTSMEEKREMNSEV